MSSKLILVLGAASVDAKGRAYESLVPTASNPGEIRVGVGGVGRNIAENLARLEVQTALLSAVGDDDFGKQIVSHTASSGVDTANILVLSEHRSATYLAILDANGVMALSIDDMSIMYAVSPRYVLTHTKLFAEAKMVVLDTNLYPETIDTAIRLAEEAQVPICIDPTSHVWAKRIKPHLARLHLITPNVAEAEVLCDMTINSCDESLVAAQRLVKMGVDIALVTMAEEGICYATEDERGHLPALECEIVDNTGAGDALTAAVIFGLLNDMPIIEALRLGLAAAAFTLQCPESVNPALTEEKLYEKLVI